MDTQHLFQNENILLTSSNKVVTLTNRRIRKSTSSIGKAHVISIHLEKISSIEIHYKSHIWLLVLGILLALAGINLAMTGSHIDEAGPHLVFAGAICILIYFLTRRHLITVASDGGARINILTRGMSRENVLNFVNKIEEAKNLLNSNTK